MKRLKIMAVGFVPVTILAAVIASSILNEAVANVAELVLFWIAIAVAFASACILFWFGKDLGKYRG